MSKNNIYFIADTHFGDSNIIKFENRPFKNVEDMNNKLIENWNNTISENDIVYILGDFSNKEYIPHLFINNKKILNGKLTLILGNHDIGLEDYYKNYNIEIIKYPIILDNFWMLSHEPMYVSEQSPYANIFGHIHNNPMYKTVSSRSYCVSVERINYTPINFTKIKEEISKVN